MSYRLVIEDNKLVIEQVTELSANNRSQFFKEVSNIIKADMDIKSVELNAKYLIFIDSCGLGTLISINKICKNKKITFKLTQIRENIKQIIELTRLTFILNIE